LRAIVAKESLTNVERNLGFCFHIFEKSPDLYFF